MCLSGVLRIYTASIDQLRYFSENVVLWIVDEIKPILQVRIAGA